LYDKTHQTFLSKREYYYFAFIESPQLQPTRKFTATKLAEYQLWVWVDDELVFIKDYQWEE